MFNETRREIITNTQKNITHKTYQLDTMDACINRGKIRKTQEDAVLITNHPLINDFKLLAVADGMGGLSNGSLASNLCLFYLLRWFEMLPANYYTKDNKIINELINEIKNIDLLVRKYCKDGGSTLAISIVTKENTFMINLGDSRIYITNGNLLTQVSVDHSISWNYYKEGLINNKDNIIFHKKNNLICSRVGCEKPLLVIEQQVLKNSDYNGLYLFSDGVTDCLTDIQIKKIIIKERKGLLSEQLVLAAINNNLTNNNLNAEDYYNEIIGGKDNATAAVYKRILK